MYISEWNNQFDNDEKHNELEEKTIYSAMFAKYSKLFLEIQKHNFHTIVIIAEHAY